jgi:hypothetical protein
MNLNTLKTKRIDAQEKLLKKEGWKNFSEIKAESPGMTIWALRHELAIQVQLGLLEMDKFLAGSGTRMIQMWREKK